MAKCEISVPVHALLTPYSRDISLFGKHDAHHLNAAGPPELRYAVVVSQEFRYH